MQKKRNFILILLAIIMTLSLTACSTADKELEKSKDTVKDQAKTLITEAEKFIADKEKLVGEVEKKIVEDFKSGEVYVITDVNKGEDLATHLKESLIVDIEKMISKADEFKTEHPRLQESKDEYKLILVDIKTQAENIITSIENKDQAAFDTAKKDFDISKEKLVGFEEKINELVSKK